MAASISKVPITSDKYAVLTRDIIRLLKPNELRVYAYCDAVQGLTDEGASGVAEIARQLRPLDRGTVRRILKRLRRFGLVRLDPSPTGRGQVEVTVIHNARRGFEADWRINPDLKLPSPLRKPRERPLDPEARRVEGIFREGGTPAVPTPNPKKPKLTLTLLKPPWPTDGIGTAEALHIFISHPAGKMHRQWGEGREKCTGSERHPLGGPAGKMHRVALKERAV